MLTIKLTDEQMEKLGVKTSDEVLSLIEGSSKLKTENQTLTDKVTGFEALEKRIEALEKRKVELSADEKTALIDSAKEAAKAEAKSEAASHVTSALAKFGGKSIGNGDKPADVSTEKKDEPKTLKDKWDADENLRAEFMNDFKVFEQYSLMNEAGRIKQQIKK